MISKLSDAFSVSGNEDTVRDLILSSINNSLFNVTCDKTGNIIAKYTGREDAPSVLLASHMDECGIIITDICDDGYLKFDVIGDIDVSSLVSKRVKSEKANGVISLKAVHLVDKDDKGKAVKIKDLYIDIGAKSKEEALNYVTVGDLFTFSNSFKHLSDDIIVGKALSRSVSAYILLDFINKFKGGNVNITCIFTALKEVGGRGLKTALNSLENIKYACVLDSVGTKDNEVSLKSGPVVGILKNSSDEGVRVSEKIKGLSDNIQYEYIKDKSNADIIPADIPTLFLGFPCKNKGTNVNIVSLTDIEALKKLLNSVVSEVE